MSEAEQQMAAVAQARELISNDLISELGDAQEEVSEERGEPVNLNAVISMEDGEVEYEVLDLTDGVPDDAVHFGGFAPIVAGSNRQFTDNTGFVSVHYDARDLMTDANDNDSLDFSANYVDGSLWHVIPTPTSGSGPSIEDALADLVNEVLNGGHRLAVSLDGAEDLLRTE